MIRRVVWIGLAIGLVVAFALAWRPQPIAVEVRDVARGDLVVTVDELGRTRVRDRYVVSAPIAGSLLRIELRPGDAVEAGTVLARLVPTAAPLVDPRTRAEAKARVAAAGAVEQQTRAAVARANAAAEHAGRELDRARKLAATGSVSSFDLSASELDARLRSDELTSARFAARAAAHDVVMAGAALRRYDTPRSDDGFDVTSPASGRVLRVIEQSAGVVQAGTALIELGDPTGLEIVSEVLTADAVRIRPGANAIVQRWGGAPLRARVHSVEPSAFTRISALGVEEQRVLVVLDFDDARDKWSVLGDGFRVELRMNVAERRGVAHIPLGAAFRHDGGWAAWVVRDGGAHLVAIETGERSDSDVEISKGLAPGDRVIVHPSEAIREGVRVTAR